jgi:hypothetical protein
MQALAMLREEGERGAHRQKKAVGKSTKTSQMSGCISSSSSSPPLSPLLPPPSSSTLLASPIIFLHFRGPDSHTSKVSETKAVCQYYFKPKF